MRFLFLLVLLLASWASAQCNVTTATCFPAGLCGCTPTIDFCAVVPQLIPQYAYVYSEAIGGSVVVPANSDVVFVANGPSTPGIVHPLSSPFVTVNVPGFYKMSWTLSVSPLTVFSPSGNLVGLAIGIAPIPGCTYVLSNANPIEKECMAALIMGDVIVLRNYGPATLTLQTSTVIFGMVYVNAGLSLIKL